MTAKLDTLQKIEIAEGVEIQLHVAGPLARGQAFLIDVLIKAGVWLAGSIALSLIGVMIIVAFGGKTGSGVNNGLGIIWGFVLEVCYSIGFEVSPWSATPGKRIVGLRVIRTSGAPITWHQAVVRNMLRVIDLMGITGVVACLVNDRFQRLGDLAADTLVVYADPPSRPQQSSPAMESIPPFRPGAALTREEQGAILEYADRYPDWPQHRAEELAGHIRTLTRMDGGNAVVRILGMARWIRGEG